MLVSWWLKKQGLSTSHIGRNNLKSYIILYNFISYFEHKKVGAHAHKKTTRNWAKWTKRGTLDNKSKLRVSEWPPGCIQIYVTIYTPIVYHIENKFEQDRKLCIFKGRILSVLCSHFTILVQSIQYIIDCDIKNVGKNEILCLSMPKMAMMLIYLHATIVERNIHLAVVRAF